MSRVLTLFTILLLLLVVGESSATDLTPKALKINPTPRVTQASNLTVTVANINILDATNFSIRVQIFNDNINTSPTNVDFDKTLTGLTIPKNSEKDFAIPIAWTPGWYGNRACIIEVFFGDDIDLSNNKLTTVTFVDFAHVESDAADLIIGWLKANVPLSDSARQALAMLPEPVPAGTKITSYDPKELDITLSADSWIGWYRNDKYDRYTSMNGVVIMNDKDSATTYYRTEWWVNINGTPITQNIVDSNYIYGTTPSVPAIDSQTINSSQSGTGDLMECAILISGEGSDPREQQAFNTDVDMFETNLRLEKLGPHVQAANIVKLYAPSAGQVLAAIDSLKGKCKKIWFFYSGHGDSTISTSGTAFGWMVTKDSSLAYWKLFDHLFATGADDLSVLIDACHSGVAIEELKTDADLANHNINVITACQTGETSKSYFIGPDHQTGFGGFTLYWLKCFGDPSAEADGVPGISEQEALDCLRRMNPEFPNGKHLFDEFHPRSIFHHVERSVPPNTPVSMGQTSVIVTLKEGPPNTPMTVTLDNPATGYIDFPGQKLSDSSISALSYGRMWDLTFKPSISFKMDVEFQTVPGIDTFAAGSPGILHREDSGKPWSVYTPYYFNSSKNSIMAIGVDKFSQWVMASVTKPQAGVASGESRKTTISALPSISHGNTTIKLSLATDEDITVAIYDLLGKKHLVAAAGVFPQGEYWLPISTASFSPGMYVVTVNTKAGVPLTSTKLDVME